MKFVSMLIMLVCVGMAHGSDNVAVVSNIAEIVMDKSLEVDISSRTRDYTRYLVRLRAGVNYDIQNTKDVCTIVEYFDKDGDGWGVGDSIRSKWRRLSSDGITLFEHDTHLWVDGLNRIVSCTDPDGSFQRRRSFSPSSDGLIHGRPSGDLMMVLQYEKVLLAALKRM